MDDLKNKKSLKIEAGVGRVIISILIKIALFTLVVYILLFRLFGFERIDGNIMHPRISDGDLSLIYRLDDNYGIGDVVIYSINGVDHVGRIVAQNDDVVDVDEKKNIAVNGGVEDVTSYGTNAFPEKIDFSYPYKLSKDQFFILGDNREEFGDSRSYGGIFKVDIKGKVIGVFRTHAI